MKKIFAMITLLCFASMLFQIPAFADKKPPPKPNPLLREVRMCEITVKRNIIDIEKLKKGFEHSYTKAKIKIKNIQNNKTRFTPERAERLREILVIIDEDTTAMGISSDELDKGYEDYDSKEDISLTERRDLLYGIIKLQNTHIENLAKIIIDINQINKV